MICSFFYMTFFLHLSCCGLTDKLICDLTIEKKKISLKLMPDEDNLTLSMISEFIRNNGRNCKITSSS